MPLTKVSDEETEEALASHWVKELVREILLKHKETNARLVEVAAAGQDYPARVNALAGMVAAYADVIRLIGAVE